MTLDEFEKMDKARTQGAWNTSGHDLSDEDCEFINACSYMVPKLIALAVDKKGCGNKIQPRQVPGHAENSTRHNLHKIPVRETRNRRSVWSVTTKSFKGAHFATFPPDLIEPCILAGSPKGGVVLDPFFGAGTTGLVAQRHGRRYIGIELNSEYIAIARKRLEAQ